MPVYNQSSDINAMLRKYGVAPQFHRQIEAEAGGLFGYSNGVFMPRNGGETVKNFIIRRHDELRAVSFRKPVELQEIPPAGAQDGLVTAAGPALRPVRACPAHYEVGNPERALENYARVSMPRGYTWDGSVPK